MHKLVISAHACKSLTIVDTLEKLGADACIDKHEISLDPAAFCKKVVSLISRPKKQLAVRAVVPGSATPAQPRLGLVSIAARPYPVPFDEQARLQRLATLELANDDEDAQLDRLTAHLGQTTDFPTCLITFIDRETQWLKSAYGFSRGAMERAEAFCNYTLCGGETLIVPNATLDDRFKMKQAVVETPCIRTYVGHPIVTATGVRLGAICLLDTHPRNVSPADLVNLRSICGIAGSILDARATLRQQVA